MITTDNLAQFAEVSFIDTSKAVVRRVQMRWPTGLSGATAELKYRCLGHAHDYGYDRWIQPGLWDAALNDHQLVVFRNMAGRIARALKAFDPGQLEAAEMWALHHE